MTDDRSTDAPIPALLPRDWPRYVQRLCDDLQASPAARRAANELIDAWVLAAVDADAASTDVRSS